ncbi:hypothetical protein QWA_18227 [Alcaligenes faecalis subsp. faecalis NCIB 8687]|nr:hypothetical protein QWA_18227 [Alcaligenes faecalis subsp. faecalis NCIB 8687]
MDPISAPYRLRISAVEQIQAQAPFQCIQALLLRGPLGLQIQIDIAFAGQIIIAESVQQQPGSPS